MSLGINITNAICMDDDFLTVGLVPDRIGLF